MKKMTLFFAMTLMIALIAIGLMPKRVAYAFQEAPTETEQVSSDETKEGLDGLADKLWSLILASTTGIGLVITAINRFSHLKKGLDNGLAEAKAAESDLFKMSEEKLSALIEKQKKEAEELKEGLKTAVDELPVNDIFERIEDFSLKLDITLDAFIKLVEISRIQIEGSSLPVASKETVYEICNDCEKLLKDGKYEDGD